MQTPTAAECEAFRLRLTEADEALHKLRTGTKAASIRMGEKSVEYTAASIGELSRYVEYLRARVRQCEGCGWTGRRAFTVTPTN